MAIEFDVKITWKHLFSYLLYTAYTGPGGLVGTCIGAILIAAYFWQHKALFLVAGILIILYIPWSLFQQALKNATQPIFAKPMHYTVSEEGIRVTQGEIDESVTWDNVYRAASTPNALYIYMNKRSASIWPKSVLGEDKYAVIGMISTHIPPERNKIKE